MAEIEVPYTSYACKLKSVLAVAGPLLGNCSNTTLNRFEDTAQALYSNVPAHRRSVVGWSSEVLLRRMSGVKNAFSSDGGIGTGLVRLGRVPNNIQAPIEHRPCSVAQWVSSETKECKASAPDM